MSHRLLAPHQANLADILRMAPVIPVVVIDEISHALPLARALVAGGLPVIEITLRTATALEAIRRIAAEVEGAVVGAGTVLTPSDLHAVLEAGARFAVSPGSTPKLLDAAADHDIPMLPGAVTASEAMGLLERGHRWAKFFPASAMGGAATLRALSGPLPQIGFCATGGIGPHEAPEYLALPNVACVGGSWITPVSAMKAGNWSGIEDAARAAAKLGTP